MNDSYLYSFNRKRYQKLAERKLLSKDKLNCKVIEDGYILPARPASNILFGRGGVADSKGEYVQESAMRANAAYISLPMDESEKEIYLGEGYEIELNETKKAQYPYLDETVIYLGFINNHWGHFLLDSLNRIYYVLNLKREQAKSGAEKNYKLVYIVAENTQYEMIPNIRRFFELLGINPDEIIFVNQVTRAREILLPEQSYCINGHYSKEFLEIFNQVAGAVDLAKYEKKEQIYYTRSNFKKAKETESGEEIFVDLFARNGFALVSPEQLSLDEQIALIRNSKVLAMEIGTIPHNMLFAKNGQKLLILNKTHNVNVAQMDINLMKDLDVTYIDCYDAAYPVQAGDGPFLLSYSKPLQQYVADKGWRTPQESLVAEEVQWERARQYEKNFRNKYYYYHHMSFGKDENRFDYFPPELLIAYQEKYYDAVRPFTKQEYVKTQWKRVMRHIKK